MKILAIILVASGVLMLTFLKPEPEFNQQVVKIDGVEIVTKDKAPLYWSPFVSTVLIITGILLIIAVHESSKHRQKKSTHIDS